MRQVKLIINEYFDGEIVFRIDDSVWKDEPFAKRVTEIIFEMTETNGVHYWLKHNFSLEDIIESLWEYQKSMLPFGWFLQQWNSKEFCGCWDAHHIKIRNFYDPETRIITITSFEQEADQ